MEGGSYQLWNVVFLENHFQNPWEEYDRLCDMEVMTGNPIPADSKATRSFVTGALGEQPLQNWPMVAPAFRQKNATEGLNSTEETEMSVKGSRG